MKTELRFHSFLSRHCSFSVPPSLAPKLPMRHDPVDDRNDLHVDGRPHHDPSNDTSLAHTDVVTGKGRGVEEEVMMNSFW